MYAAVRGLRRLLHELTVTGVAAARYAALEAREKLRQLYATIEAFQAKLTKAKAAQATAFATLAPLQARLVALRKANPGEQSAAAETLSLEIAAAETVYVGELKQGQPRGIGVLRRADGAGAEARGDSQRGTAGRWG